MFLWKKWKEKGKKHVLKRSTAMERGTYLVGDVVLLGVVILGLSGNDQDDLSGERGDDLGGAGGLRRQIHVYSLGLLYIERWQHSIGLDVDLLRIEDINGRYDVIEDDIGLGASLCRRENGEKRKKKKSQIFFLGGLEPEREERNGQKQKNVAMNVEPRDVGPKLVGINERSMLARVHAKTGVVCSRDWASVSKWRNFAVFRPTYQW